MNGFMTCYTLKNTIQIDGIKRQVFTDFITEQQAATLFHLTNGHALYEHTNGEMSPAYHITGTYIPISTLYT
jgi:hypothetical protein